MSVGVTFKEGGATIAMFGVQAGAVPRVGDTVELDTVPFAVDTVWWTYSRLGDPAYASVTVHVRRRG